MYINCGLKFWTRHCRSERGMNAQRQNVSDNNRHHSCSSAVHKITQQISSKQTQAVASCFSIVHAIMTIFIYHDTYKKINKLQCGPMPIVMAAQPNIGSALCESSAIPFLVPRRKI